MYKTLIPAVFLLAHPLVAGNVTYTYTGNPFTTVAGKVVSGDYLTISVTLPTALLANQKDQVVTPLAWSISDGVAADTLTNLNHTYIFQGFEFATDASGNITGWAVGANTGSASGFSWTANNWIVFGGITTLDEYYESTTVSLNQRQPGKWVSSVGTATPEPAPALMMLPLFLLVLRLQERRKQF